MFKILVDGYLAGVQSQLKDTIPRDIKVLCLAYYYLNSTLICVVEDNQIADKYNSKLLYFADIDENNPNDSSPKAWNYSSDQFANPDNTFVTKSFISTQKYVSLPEAIRQEHKMSNDSSFNAIFKLQRNENETEGNNCVAFIFDERDQNRMFEWPLPSLPNMEYMNSLVYSVKYGLLCICGFDSAVIYRLMLDETNLGWKLFSNPQTKTLSSYDAPSYASMACMINNDRHLFVNGGLRNDYSKAHQTTKIYDMQTNKWVGVKRSIYGTANSGIFYDMLNDRVFIGLCCADKWRRKPLNKVQCYDICKDMWTELADTELEHTQNALIWKPYHQSNSILNVASMNGMESMDLRVNKKKWKVVCSSFDSLFDKFSEWDSVDQESLTLLRFQ